MNFLLPLYIMLPLLLFKTTANFQSLLCLLSIPVLFAKVLYICMNKLRIYKGKGKVFYGQEPPSGESTNTESGVNYQLLSVMH